MKKVFLCAALLLSIFAAKAQQIELDEAKVLYTPQVIKIKSDKSSSTYQLKLRESSAGIFYQNPIAFMQKHLKMKNIIELLDEKNESFTVTFKSQKGSLVANFDENGNLTNTSQNFKNIIVPKDIREELYRDYKGWEMVKNKYVAKGNSTFLEKQTYKVKLKKGNRTKTITLEKGGQEYAVAMR